MLVVMNTNATEQELFTILANGNFGFANNNPQYRVDVNGVIHSNTGIFSDGYVSAKGQNTSSDMRLKNVLNNVEGVSESIVVERNGRLIALVQPMDNFIDWDKESEDKMYEKIDGWKKKILSITNKSVNKSSQVSSVEVMKEPFEKTATQKIRRFKYKESAPTVEEEVKKK